MNIRFKITSALLAQIRGDLRRPHAFAFERVGFIAAGFVGSTDGMLAVSQSYRPVADDDYIHSDEVGAMIGSEAIRKAMQWALKDGVSIFHVHSHGGKGLPNFSGIDLREQANFMPSFLNVAARHPHGAIVLSDDAARGQVWIGRGGTQAFISEFTEVGAPLHKWRGI